MSSSTEEKLHPEIVMLMKSRRDTLNTRELINRWKHDHSRGQSAGSEDSQRGPVHRNGRTNSALAYIDPTRPNKTIPRLTSGVLMPKRRSCRKSCQPSRQTHSAPVKAGHQRHPGNEWLVTSQTQQRLDTGDSQFSALMRTTSAKPIPHLYGRYVPLDERKKPLKSPSNLQRWKEQVVKRVEDRPIYSLPVEYKTTSSSNDVLSRDRREQRTGSSASFNERGFLSCNSFGSRVNTASTDLSAMSSSLTVVQKQPSYYDNRMKHCALKSHSYRRIEPNLCY